MPENLPIESVDAVKPVVPAEPAGPPAGYLSGLDITEEMIDAANWRDKDRLNVATDLALDEPEGIDYSNIDECVNVLRGRWGADYDARVAVVVQQVKEW